MCPTVSFMPSSQTVISCWVTPRATAATPSSTAQMASVNWRASPEQRWCRRTAAAAFCTGPTPANMWPNWWRKLWRADRNTRPRCTSTRRTVSERLSPENQIWVSFFQGYEAITFLVFCRANQNLVLSWVNARISLSQIQFCFDQEVIIREIKAVQGFCSEFLLDSSRVLHFNDWYLHICSLAKVNWSKQTLL